MDEHWRKHPHLQALVRTRLATALLRAEVPAEGGEDLDELAVLDLVETHVEDPVFRLGVGAYAILIDDAEARDLEDALRAAHPQAAVTLDMLTADTPQPGGSDIAALSAKLDLLAERIDAAGQSADLAPVLSQLSGLEEKLAAVGGADLSALETRLDQVLERAEGERAADPAPVVERLDAIDAALREVGATSPRDLLERVEALAVAQATAEATLMAKVEELAGKPASLELAETLDRLEDAVEALAHRPPADQSDADPNAQARAPDWTPVLSRLDVLDQAAAARASALQDRIIALAEAEPGTGPDFAAPLGSFDALLTRLEDQTAAMGVTLDDRLGALSARLEGVVDILGAKAAQLDLPDLAPQISALEGGLRDAIAALPRQVAEEAGRAMGEVAEDLRRQFEGQSERLDQVADLARKPATMPDVLQERQGIIQVSLALQAMLRRLDTQIGLLEAANTQVRPPAQPPADVLTALSEMEMRVGAQIDALAELAGADGGPGDDLAGMHQDLSARLDGLAAQLAEPSRLPDLLEQKQGLVQVTLVLQSLLRQLEGRIAPLVPEGAPDAGNAALDALGERVVALGSHLDARLEALVNREMAATRDALDTRLAAIEARLPAAVRPQGDGEGLARMSTALATILRRLDGQADVLEQRATASGGDLRKDLDAFAARLDSRLETMLSTELSATREALSGRIAALEARMPSGAARPVSDTGDLAKMSTALGTILRRLDGQATRLEAQAQSNTGPDLADLHARIEGLSAAMQSAQPDLSPILAEFLAQIERRMQGGYTNGAAPKNVEKSLV